MLDIVGRREELALLESFLSGPRPSALVIDGDAGIGKTTLWRHSTLQAEQLGHLILSASATESETQLPFTAIGDLLSDTAGEVLDRLPHPQRRALEVALLLAEPGTSPPDRRTIGVALVGAFRLLAVDRPVLLAVDDVQWLDAASRNAIEFVLRRLRDENVGFLVTKRLQGEDEELPLGLARAFATERSQRIRLRPLSLGATSALIRTTVGISLRRPTLLRIHEVSEGNPFYALELARSLLGAGESEASQELPLPGLLRDVVRERVATLPKPTLNALLSVAALSDPVLSTVEEVLGTKSQDLLQPALDVRVIEVQSNRVRFVHPLFRSAVYQDSPPSRRRAVHAQLARLDLPVEELARHRALSTTEPDETTATLLEEATHAAARRGAPESAAEFAEHAVRLTLPADVERLHERRVLAAENLWAAGDYDRGRKVFEEGIAKAPSARLKAAALLMLAKNPRNIAESRRFCEQAIAERPEDPALQADILLWLAELEYVLGELPRAISHAEASAASANEAGDVAREAFARGLRSWLIGVAGGGWDLDVLRRAADLEASTSPRPLMDGLEYIFGLALTWTDEFNEARQRLESLAERGRQAGDVTRIEVLNVLAQGEHRAGAVAQAKQHLDEAVDLARDFGVEQVEASVVAPRALIDAALGRVEEARRACEWILNTSERTAEELALVRVDVVLGFLEMSLGNPAAARIHLEHGLAALDRFGIRDPAIYPVAPYAVEAAVELGDVNRAEEVTTSLEQFAQAHPRPRATVYALRCRGLIEAGRGNLDAAVAKLEQAVQEQEALPAPFEHAMTFLVLGRIQRRARQKRAARESLDAAARIFDELGYRLWLDRTREELRRIGGRTASRFELTPTEERVASLVAEGKTNKEVAAELMVSVRAVEANLSRIYQKLQVRSRAELARSYRSS